MTNAVDIDQNSEQGAIYGCNVFAFFFVKINLSVRTLIKVDIRDQG